MSREGYDLFEGGDIWAALACAYRQFQAGESAHHAVEQMLTLERLPAIDLLIATGVIRLEEVVRLRTHPACQDFRKWLWTQPDPSSAKDVGEAYLASMIPSARWRDSEWFKAGKLVTMSILGNALGAAAVAPLDPGASSAVGFAVGAVAGTVASLSDGFILDSLLREKNPRRFATDVLAPRLARAKLRK